MSALADLRSVPGVGAAGQRARDAATIRRVTRTELGYEDGDPTARLRALRPSADEVTLAGPWPEGALPGAVRAARAEGFGRVGVALDGRGGAGAEALGELARAGLTDLHAAVYGAEGAVHDYHAGEGSLDAVGRCLARARSLGVTAVVTTPLTRSNARSLGALPPWLAARGVAAWAVAVPRTPGARGVAFDRVYPRLAMALPYALHAVEGARKAALPAWVRGAPWCLLGPYASRALPEEPRAYGPMCAACPARGRCPGVDAAYLERFRGDELSPARLAPRPAPPGPGPREAELARMLAAGAFAPPGLGGDSAG